MKNKFFLGLTVVISFAGGVLIGRQAQQPKSGGIGQSVLPTAPIISGQAVSYQLLDPLRVGRPQEDFAVEFAPLRNKLQTLIDEWGKRGVVVAVQLEYLNTGSYLSINQNYRMLPASLTKVPVVMMVMRKIEQGQLSMEQELEITAPDRDSKWGTLYKQPVGTKLKLSEVIERSLVDSDNTAHKMLYRLVGIDEARDLSEVLNLEDLFDQEGKITAREYARLLRSLYSSSYLRPEDSQLILGYLTRDQQVKFLIRGFGGVPYAHKFGESTVVRSYLDAGIVYVPNRPFVIVVMAHDEKGEVELNRETAGKEIFEPIAKDVYEYIARK